MCVLCSQCAESIGRDATRTAIKGVLSLTTFPPSVLNNKFVAASGYCLFNTSMGKKSKGRRRASAGHKVSIPRTIKNGNIRARYRNVIFAEEKVKEVWDPKKSSAVNMGNLGLAPDSNRAVAAGTPAFSGTVGPNSISSSPESSAKVVEFLDIPQADTLTGNDINERRRNLPLLEHDQKYAAKILGKHGKDYRAAARDIKLNNKQFTPAQLKRICEKFLLLNKSQRSVPMPEGISPS